MSEAQRRHEHYMRLALDEARRAGDGGDVPVGCVIVRDDDVVGVGGNAIERTGDPTRHAEVVAIGEAVRHLGEKFLDGCTMYVTLEPCSMCAGAIVLARIPMVVYAAADEKTGACRSLFDLVDDPRLNHRATVRSGILADESRDLLQRFFAERRRGDTPTPPPSPTDGMDTLPRQPGAKGAGCLTLVPTPIGNIEDITARALRALREADVICCEDTRHTGQLLQRYGKVRARLVSNHEHNERDRGADIVRWLREGQRVVLVSDAGMPAIADPGYRAVRACVEAGLRVEALPGPSAFVTAAAASGLATDMVLFAGFPPQKKGRLVWLERQLRRRETVVCYESPYRVAALLEDAERVAGPSRPVCLAREISKLHEEYLRGSIADVRAAIQARGGVKGECVVVFGGSPEEDGDVHLV